MASSIWIWDPLRWYLIISGLLFGLLTGPCIFLTPQWDQKIRFVALLGYQTLTVQLMFRGLGSAYNWYHWAITLLGLLAMLGTVVFLINTTGKKRRGGAADRGVK